MRTLLIGAALAAIAVPAQAQDTQAKGDAPSAREAADRAARERWEKRPRMDAPSPDPRATSVTPASPPFQPYAPPNMTTNPTPYTNPYGSPVTAPYSPAIPAGPNLP